jgi:hypothetical protein
MLEPFLRLEEERVIVNEDAVRGYAAATCSISAMMFSGDSQRTMGPLSCTGR